MRSIPRRVATTQPSGTPELIRDRGIGVGLIGFLWMGPGGKARELVGPWWDVLETGITRQAGGAGIRSVSAGASTDAICSARLGAPAWAPTALPITYLAFFDHTAPASSMCIAGYSSNSDGYFLHDLYGARGRRVNVKIGATQYNRESGTWGTGAAVRGLTADATSIIGYDAGVSFGSTATAAGSITYDATYSRKVFLGFGSDSGGTAGYGYWEALWNRVLTPTEIAALARNPWMLFAALPRWIWAPSVAAGGFQAAWASRQSGVIGAGV